LSYLQNALLLYVVLLICASYAALTCWLFDLAEEPMMSYCDNVIRGVVACAINLTYLMRASNCVWK